MKFKECIIVVLSSFFLVFALVGTISKAKVKGSSIPDILVADTELIFKVKRANSLKNPLKVVLFTEDGVGMELPAVINKKKVKLKF